MTWHNTPGEGRRNDRRMNVVAAIFLLAALAGFFFLWGLTVGAVLWR